MHQTIYIETDEEITGILDKIRQEPAVEIFVVVPKGAMILNSILNLKLLKKETELMGKSIVIVAPNDKQAQTMIERAGIRFEQYQKTIGETGYSLNQNNVEASASDEDGKIAQTVEEIANRQIHQTTVGSSSFFSDSNNFKNSSSNYKINDNEQLVEKNNKNRLNQPQDDFGNVEKSDKSELVQKEFNYFHENSRDDRRIKKRSKKRRQHKKQGIFFGTMAGGIFLVLLIVGWYMVNYPKLNVNIQPLFKNVDAEVKVVARDDVQNIDFDENIIPGEYLEMNIEKEKEFPATGTKILDKNGARASGVVTIYNYFSEKPQPLVKTTRVLSESGKLFRLTKGVIVPGMKDDQPGKIEVSVQADKPGKDFNIGKEKFTIEGFKGGPKYEKFEVIGNGAMTGGVTSTDSKKVKVVSANDLDRARKNVIQELDDNLMKEISKRLSPGQVVIESTVKKEVVSSKASHLAQSIADKFKYKVVYRVKLIAVNKSDLESVVEDDLSDKAGKNYIIDNKQMRINANRGILDVDKKSMVIYVQAQVPAWFRVDQIKLKQQMVGHSIEDIKNSLNKAIGVEKAEIFPSPSWSKKAPKDIDKITIKVLREK